jgi:hypothetical protein
VRKNGMEIFRNAVGRRRISICIILNPILIEKIISAEILEHKFYIKELNRSQSFAK